MVTQGWMLRLPGSLVHMSMKNPSDMDEKTRPIRAKMMLQTARPHTQPLHETTAGTCSPPPHMIKDVPKITGLISGFPAVIYGFRKFLLWLKV